MDDGTARGAAAMDMVKTPVTTSLSRRVVPQINGVVVLKRAKSLPISIYRQNGRPYGIICCRIQWSIHPTLVFLKRE